MLPCLLAAALAQPADALHPVDLEGGSGLERLGAITSEATVFGIGESIHASAGLEEARTAAAMVAIGDLGFRAVAIEISWVEARRVDALLKRCANGELVDILAETSGWTPLWEAYQPLLESLCRRDASAPPLHVFGIDITDPWSARDLLEVDGADATLRAHCWAVRFDSSRELAAWAKANDYPRPTRRHHRACLRHLARLARHGLSEDGAMAVQTLRANQQRVWTQYVRNDVPGAYTVREEAMTAVFHAEHHRLGQPRTILFAHDNHVALRNDQYHPIGARLAEQLSYAALSVDGLRVETRLGERFDPPVPDPDDVRHQWAGVEGPAVLVLHPGARHDATLYLDHAKRR